jgi:hypothetical protein
MVEDPDLFDMINIEPPGLKLPEEEGNWLEGDSEEE